MYKGLILVALFVASSFALAPLLKSVEPIEDSYIVVFNDNITAEELALDFQTFTAVHAVEYEFTYSKALKGFAATMSAAQVFSARSHPHVQFVEQNQVMRASQTCTSVAARPWGIQRVCQQHNPAYSGVHRYPTTAANVDAYIIDTGIYLANSDFTGRAVFGFKSNAAWSNTDNNGHGTHVASTVAGIQFGIAKGARLIAVKVLGDNGSGTTAGVIAGVDWTLGNSQSTGRRSVGNMSLGGGWSQALNNAVNTCSSGGCPVVVAAGNDNWDACDYSPASAANSICVGATTQTDVRSTFSNYGPCVHVFAPGTGILGAWIGGTGATNTISGTSMAAPHVCGVAALLASLNPSWNYLQIRNGISNLATQDALSLNCGNPICNQSPNELLYNNC